MKVKRRKIYRQYRPRIKPSLARDASPESYGEAMLVCLDYAPACSDAHECARDGYCFSRDGLAYSRALRRMRAMIANEKNTACRVWLRGALEWMEQRRFADTARDVLRYVEIGREVRARYADKSR